MSVRAPAAILLLGGRVAPAGRTTNLLSRRIATAVEAAQRWPQALVVACGGRAWDGFVEADVMARELMERSVDASRVVRERLSLTTFENLREGSACARARGKSGLFAIVSCAWHLPRAMVLARVLGLEAIGVPAATASTSTMTRLARTLHESIALPLDLLRARLG